MKFNNKTITICLSIKIIKKTNLLKIDVVVIFFSSILVYKYER